MIHILSSRGFGLYQECMYVFQFCLRDIFFTRDEVVFFFKKILCYAPASRIEDITRNEPIFPKQGLGLKIMTTDLFSRGHENMNEHEWNAY